MLRKPFSGNSNSFLNNCIPKLDHTENSLVANKLKVLVFVWVERIKSKNAGTYIYTACTQPGVHYIKEKDIIRMATYNLAVHTMNQSAIYIYSTKLFGIGVQTQLWNVAYYRLYL